MIFNRLVLQNLYTSGSVSFVWFIEVNNNGASDENAIGLEFGMKYKAIIPGEEQTTHSYTQGFTMENYQVCISNMWGRTHLKMGYGYVPHLRPPFCTLLISPYPISEFFSSARPYICSKSIFLFFFEKKNCITEPQTKFGKSSL